MKVVATELPEVLLLEPRVFGDERGHFFESYNSAAFDAAIGHTVTFVQDNQSVSARGVLRGLHYQRAPHAQGKLVRVTQGRVFDVAVDVRRESARFGRWMGVELSAANFRQLWIPPGFAHGFLALEEASVVQYKTTDYYARDAEGCIAWNDPAIGIRWPLQHGEQPLLSQKDAAAPPLEMADL
jgi:dTDP-4-dehydrorhamnose 3,5-epimerase